MARSAAVAAVFLLSAAILACSHASAAADALTPAQLSITGDLLSNERLPGKAAVRAMERAEAPRFAGSDSNSDSDNDNVANARRLAAADALTPAQLSITGDLLSNERLPGKAAVRAMERAEAPRFAGSDNARKLLRQQVQPAPAFPGSGRFRLSQGKGGRRMLLQAAVRPDLTVGGDLAPRRQPGRIVATEIEAGAQSMFGAARAERIAAAAQRRQQAGSQARSYQQVGDQIKAEIAGTTELITTSNAQVSNAQ